jgi:predicted transcriptional regulator/RimJ/RimL family protein N-acetyltransferase
MTKPRSPIVFLSIRKRHFERILDGEKKYELRKTPFPSHARAALVYVPEDGALVGVLRLGESSSGPIERLWQHVKAGGIAREDFTRYYSGLKLGSVSRIVSAEVLPKPLRLSRLKEMKDGFQPPQGIVVLPPQSPIVTEVTLQSGLLSSILSSADRASLADWDDIRFRSISDSEIEEFEHLSTEAIGENYDQIDETFARSIVDADREGHDRYGHFTRGKRIRVVLIDGRKAGFIVTTHKLGGSVKYGPFILTSEFRRKGLGPRVRQKLDARLKEQGVRKSYSTIPDDHYALKYLLKCGYTVEAHLREQYSIDHGDLVLGKVLNEIARPPISTLPARTEVVGGEITSGVQSAEFRRYIMANIGHFYDEITLEFCDQLILALERFDPSNPVGKGKRIYVIQDHEGRIHGAVICSVKRGGSVKLAPFLLNTTIALGLRLLHFAEREMTFPGITRKFYTHIPLADAALLGLFSENGYVPEGILHEPYRPGVHMVVMSRFALETLPK